MRIRNKNVDDITITLPKSYGKGGASFSTALLDVLRQQKYSSSSTTTTTTTKTTKQQLTYKQLFQEVHQKLEATSTTAINQQRPMLLASRKISVDRQPFTIVPPITTTTTTTTTSHFGKKYALLIAVGYNNDGRPLLPKAYDAVKSWSDYLVRHEKFSPNHITILSDAPSSSSSTSSSSASTSKDGRTTNKSHTNNGSHYLPPTHGNILNSFRHIAYSARDGDVVFVQFIGHCSLIKPKSTKPAVLFPSDYNNNNNNNKTKTITTDDLLRTLILPLKAGVHMTVLLDTCHGAGSNVLSLPYSYIATPSRNNNTERDEMIREVTFEVLGGVGALVVLGSVLAATDASDCCDASLLCQDALDCGHCF